jgi:hypothetical protein
MGVSCSKRDGSIVGHPAGGTIWAQGQQDMCFNAGGYKWTTGIGWGQQTHTINPNAPCASMASCNGKIFNDPSVGAEVCGPGNKLFVCNGSVDGGVWNESSFDCEEGADGSCPTHCGEMTLCGGEKVTKSKIGAVECGDGYLSYKCGVDGKWAVGGADGKEVCTCMTICPDLEGCESTLAKQKIGAQVCGFDRKTRICEKNLVGPPTWTYGKKCACPGDAPEPVPTPVAAPAPVVTSADDNTMLYAGLAFMLLFIVIIVVVLMFVMRSKRGRGEAELYVK